MPKSAQKRQNDHSKETSSDSMASGDHDYVKGMENYLENEEFPALPVTPSKPPVAKKPTLLHGSTNSLNSDEIVNKLASLINTRCDALEEMVKLTSSEIKDLKEKIGGMEMRIEKD